MRIVLRGPAASAGEAREALRRLAEGAGLPDAVRHDLLVVADELVGNWLKYGRAGAKEPEMEIQACVDASRLLLRFADTGPAFNPLAAAPPDLDVPLEERAIGGLGLLLVRELTDTQRYARVGDRNVLELSLSTTR